MSANRWKYTTHDTSWVPSVLKNGKPGKRLIFTMGPEYTPLNKCEVCGKLSTPKKVQIRNDVYGWNKESTHDFLTDSKSMLCMGCWNRIRPLVKREQQAEQIRTLINKLQRNFKHECQQINSDDRSTA